MSIFKLSDLFDPFPSTTLYYPKEIPKISPFLFLLEDHFDLLAVSPSTVLGNLAERVAALERGVVEKRDRKYKWTAEVEGERKLKWAVEAKASGERNFKFEEEIPKGKGRKSRRTYTFEASTQVPNKNDKNKGKSDGSRRGSTRIVEITDPNTDKGLLYLKKALAKGSVGYSCKGKKKEMSPDDAALLIQLCYRAHLVRRAQVLRALRELAVAKAKLKEIRALFANFSYRRRIASEAVERQRFSEKIIVLLLTVEAIEGPDYIVRAAQKSMVRELEGMLETIDPQTHDRLGSIKRRTFDLPDGAIQKEMALGVSEVVQLLNQEYDDNSTA